MIRFCCFLFFSVLVRTAVPAQTLPDKREELIRKMPEDTARVNRLTDLAAEVQFENPGRAIALLEEAIPLAQRLKYSNGLAEAYLIRANLFFYEMKLDTVRQLLDMSYAQVSRSVDRASQRQKAQIIQRYAGIHQQRQQYDSAVLRYQEAAHLFKALNDNSRVIVCYYNLSGIYNSMGDARNALMYAHETSLIAKQSGDSTFILRSYMALGDAYASSKKYDSLFRIAKQGLAMANRGNQLFPVGKFHLLLGDYHEHQANYDTAIVSYAHALEAFLPINVEYEICQAMYHLGHCYLLKSDYNKAIYYLKQAEGKIRALKLDQLLAPCLMDLVVADEKAGHVKESLNYLKEYVVVRDSLTQRNNRKLVYDLEAKYQLQKKEEQIQLQQKLISQKSQLNYLLAGSVISVLVILFFTYYTYQQRRKLQEQRIRDLEQEKLLSAGEAIIKGQEEERGRLAKDLHDGLGGLLSGIKFSLTHMKSNVVLDADNALAFGRTLDMLDHSITELRRIAHNMMPEVLVKFGLSEALKSYCDSVQQSGIFQVDFQVVGMAQRLNSNTEIILYRIVQELLNNAAKHARATHVLVQLAVHESEINITVEDNGTGFNVADLNTARGAGWSSIRSRVDYLKGKVDVQSVPGKGTSVQLILPV